MNQCPRCNTMLAPGAYYCSQCGAIVPDEASQNGIGCENHSGQKAVAVCIVCGKPVCGDCAVTKDQKFFCDIKEHSVIQEEWLVIYSCESEFEADMIKQNLLQASIQSKSFSFRDHVGTYWIAQDEPVQVRVLRGQVQQAMDKLRDLGLLNAVNGSHLNN